MSTEVVIRKKEIQLEQAKLALDSAKAVVEKTGDIAVSLLSNPAVIYVGSYLTLDWLSKPKWKRLENGQNELVRDAYLSRTTAEHLMTEIDIAFVAGFLASAAGKVVGLFKP